VTPTNIHPARSIEFDELVSGLKAAHGKRLVYESRNSDGLLLYVYSQSCVYDGAWDEFTTMARGLIIDPAARRVVATPFPKFFNLGESGTAVPDISFETFEKLDGSLIIIFHHASRWQAATKGSFNSRQALWAQARLDASNLSSLVPGTTYLAEAVYPENRIVIFYEEPALVMLSAYDETGSELAHDEILSIANNLGWRTAQRQQFASISEMIACAKAMPRTGEGFVLRFENGLRLKVKGDEYKRMHALISRVTPLALWEAMDAGENIESMRRDLPEEFWGDFDQIHSLLNGNASLLIERVAAQAKDLESLSDKEVGLKLDSLDAEIRPFIFAYRKSGGDLLTGKSRHTLYRSIRPTGNSLAGYIPSYAVQRVQEEDS
jgi:RNA ligase